MEEPKQIPPELMEELVQLVKYSTEPISQIVKHIYAKHPESRAIYAKKDDARKQVVVNYITAVVQHIQSIFKPFTNKRCPECGKLVVTRRCLTCDLENKVVKQTVYS
ncbi:hypothetical protein EBR78_07620 [bacterium]|nr:hypothetical protein [bacterium]